MMYYWENYRCQNCAAAQLFWIEARGLIDKNKEYVGKKNQYYKESMFLLWSIMYMKQIYARSVFKIIFLPGYYQF